MTAKAPAIDWSEVASEATELLCDYIRIDTTNPPGGEEAGALFLRNVLARDGIDATLHDAGNARVSLTARLPATRPGGGKPMVLLSHIDVVPVEREHWQADPFAGEIRDGVIWGRGALDMKGMGVMELLVMLLMRRHGVELDRDLLLVAVADEEEGGHQGIHHLRRTAPELLEASYVLNEGAFGLCQFMGQDVMLFGLGPSEKSPCWLTLTARGEPGHASVPHDRNAVAHLIRALARIDEREQSSRLTPAVEAMFEALKKQGLVPAEMDPSDSSVLDMLAAADPFVAAITRDTVNVTGCHAGKKHNVIPASAVATIDCRLLPDTEPEAFIAEIQAMIADPSIEITCKLQHSSGQSPLESAVSEVVAEVVAERYGDDASVLPMLSPGFTDSHAYRAAGAEAYGFIPALLTRDELATIHGHNERISIENLRLGTEILFDVVTRLVGGRRSTDGPR